ncbi:hypothetical protein [Intrasporangium sp.]|uniref:hypothetical protein n=1 Tax=Intrasporangium sp. TaxID=1925024 RepID=UPI00293B4B11|nr:hypothetical protein [Intrasporangium sp.]MDV3220289.1 hypothetical protein [Intrasporangium sp.]
MPTSSPVRRSPFRWEAAGSLTAAAAGIAVQILGGADYPTVPPGLLILLAAAALVAFVHARWVVVAAAAVTVFITIGGIVTPNLRNQLADPGAVLVFTGSALQVLALLGALAFCGLASKHAFHGRGRDLEEALR